LEALTKVYQSRDQGIHALGPLDLEVPPGQFVAVIGASGCGKSTLLRILAGLERSTAGACKLNGTEITGPYERLGMVFQDAELLPWRTVKANVMLQTELRGLPRAQYEARTAELLSSVDLTSFGDKYPREISGGMAQRVALCRALVHSPDLLLMDEPFGALDALTRDRMNTLVNEIWRANPCTVVLVTHSIDEAVFLSERVIVMSPRPGTIAADIEIPFGKARSTSLHTTDEFRRAAAEVRSALERIGAL
jgi:NitT/TauT family transport system ATP-binding protein